MNPETYAMVKLAPKRVKPLITSLYMANASLNERIEQLNDHIEFEENRTQRENYRVRVARYNDQIQINYNVIDQLNSYLETMGME
ncbi:hypothetical protein EC55P1_00064 [Enterococcus phage EC55P1]|nr:hypothetical protein EC55P1_00064 [Enterococcus phage EC55P1]